MKYKIKDYKGFVSEVFGAACFIEYYPEILTTGVELLHRDGLFYVIVTSTRVIASDSSFFTKQEMEFLEGVVQIRMTKTVGVLKDLEVYSIEPIYGNEFNVMVNASEQEGEPTYITLDKREKYRNFTYVN